MAFRRAIWPQVVVFLVDANASLTGGLVERQRRNSFGLFHCGAKSVQSDLLKRNVVASTTNLSVAPFLLRAKLSQTVTEKRFVKMRPSGFEPPTDGLEIRCSILLSYGRIRDYVNFGHGCHKSVTNAFVATSSAPGQRTGYPLSPLHPSLQSISLLSKSSYGTSSASDKRLYLSVPLAPQ